MRCTTPNARSCFSSVKLRVACCRSVRKKATSIISSTKSNDSSAVTSRATPKAMPSVVAAARKGQRATCRKAMIVSWENSVEGTSRPIKYWR